MTDEDESEEERSDEPFADLLDEIDRKSRRDDDSGTSIDADAQEEVFTDEPYDAVDSDELWEELGEDDSDWKVADAHEESDLDVVPKRTFCQSCEHVTDPPEFRCTHDGTEIVEFVDTEHVRVRNCPIVAERQAESEENT